jgi:hypothetical protein
MMDDTTASPELCRAFPVFPRKTGFFTFNNKGHARRFGLLRAGVIEGVRV